MQLYRDAVLIKQAGVGTMVAGNGASVLVISRATGLPAALFSPADGTTPIANPVIAGEDGEYGFYAANGRYDLTIAHPLATGENVLDILLNDERGIPRRTAGWANGECLSTSSNQTLNTADMAAGYCLSLFNNSASPITITPGVGVTLYKGAATGVRTVGPRGLVSIWCDSGTVAAIVGSELT